MPLKRTIGEPLHFRTARAYLLEWLEGTKADVEITRCLHR